MGYQGGAVFDPEDLKDMKEKELWALLADVEILDEFNIRRELRNRLWNQGEYGQVVEMSSQVIRVARLIQEEEDVIAGEYFTQGSAHFNTREYSEAIEAYTKASEIYANLGDQYQLANSLWAKADSYFKLDLGQEAADIALESSRLFEAENSLSEAGRSMILRSRGLYYSNNFEEALSASIQARNLYRTIGNTEDVAYVDNFRVTILNSLSRPDECIEILRVCLFIWQTLPVESSTIEWQAYTSRRLAELLHKAGESQEAIEYYESAIEKYKQCEKFAEIPLCEYGIGNCYDNLDNFDAAIRSYLQARALADVNGKDGLAIDSEVSRAISLHRSKRYEEARTLNLRILSNLELEMKPDYFDTAHRVRIRAADNSLALNEWQTVLEILDGFPDYPDFEPVLQIVLWSMSIRARALFALGQIDDAYRVADDAIGGTTEDYINWVTAHLYEIRGRILLLETNREGIQDLAHAIALHLANNEDEKARELSEYFLPTNDVSLMLFANRDSANDLELESSPNESIEMDSSNPSELKLQNNSDCPQCGHKYADMVSHYTDAHFKSSCELCGEEIAGMLALESHHRVRHTD
jgi:tetratricopeptide (TPR) repeat protein